MRLVLERFAHNALALLAVTTILFFMFRLMPGTPLAAFINENLNADQQQAMLEQFGLDQADVAAIPHLSRQPAAAASSACRSSSAGRCSTSCWRCCPTR